MKYFQTTEAGDAVIARLLEVELVDEQILQVLGNQLGELVRKDGPKNLIIDLSLVLSICCSLLGTRFTRAASLACMPSRIASHVHLRCTAS